MTIGELRDKIKDLPSEQTVLVWCQEYVSWYDLDELLIDNIGYYHIGKGYVTDEPTTIYDKSPGSKIIFLGIK